jgi:hypothetical protein
MRNVVLGPRASGHQREAIVEVGGPCLTASPPGRGELATHGAWATVLLFLVGATDQLVDVDTWQNGTQTPVPACRQGRTHR